MEDTVHGGKRTGAGRKKGKQNKVNAALREKLKADGIMPLEFMLQVMRDEDQDLAVRLEMAKAAAPYLHPRLQAIEHSGKGEKVDRRSLQVNFVSVDGRPLPHLNRTIQGTITADSPHLPNNPNTPRLLPDYRARGEH